LETSAELARYLGCLLLGSLLAPLEDVDKLDGARAGKVPNQQQTPPP